MTYNSELCVIIYIYGINISKSPTQILFFDIDCNLILNPYVYNIHFQKLYKYTDFLA